MAQSGSAPALGAGGRGFESHRSDSIPPTTSAPRLDRVSDPAPAYPHITSGSGDKRAPYILLHSGRFSILSMETRDSDQEGGCGVFPSGRFIHVVQHRFGGQMTDQRRDKGGEYIGAGLAIGVSIGVALGNIGLGVALGLIFGVGMARRKGSRSE